VRIAVCAPHVPFTRGGAEIFAETLVAELRARDHDADLVTVPFKWYPGARVLSQALLWRLLDLEEADGRPVDLVVATKFPSYVVRHRNKIAWVLHQFRQAYELDGTELGQFSQSPEDRATRRAIHRLDRIALGEARKVFATSQNVADRLTRNVGIDADVMPHPPQKLDYRCEAYDSFVLSVGRLDRAKRLDLLLRALQHDGDLRAVIVGEGPDHGRLLDLSGELRLTGRVLLAGRLSDDEVAALYARCLAVYYAPVDEDFGMVPYEAFLSEKPVVTTTDAGGPLEIVTDRRTGVVVAPEPEAIGSALSWLDANRAEAAAFGRAGRTLAERVTWDAAIERLLAAGS
jgi:glycosyltransferase involved in cell wall biosynthesis